MPVKEKVIRKTSNPTSMIKPLKSFSDIIKNVWGYFMTFVAVVTFIWTLGVKSERKTMSTEAIKTDIASLKLSVQKIDTLVIIMNTIQEKQNEIIASQNALRDSYVEYIINSPGLQTTDFIKYMQGIEFEIKPNDQIINSPIKIDSTNYTPSIIIRQKR